MEQHARPDPSTYIGGSDAPILMGCGYGGKSKLDLWMEFSGLAETPVVDNEPARWGLLLEPFVAEEFARQQSAFYGHKVDLKQGVFKTHPEFSFIGGHPDFEFQQPASFPIKRRILECKTSMSRNYSGGLPLGVYWQCQHYNFVTESSGCDVFIALLDTREFQHYKVESNLDDFEKMKATYEDFWQHVRSGKPPTPETAHDLEVLYQEPNDLVIDATPRQMQMVQRLEELKLVLKPLEEERKALEEDLKFSMGETQKLIIDDRTSCTWKPIKSSRFDAKAFQRAYPELHEQFKTQTTFRRFSINHSKRKSS
jgi:predicted phage-related endonuclease